MNYITVWQDDIQMSCAEEAAQTDISYERTDLQLVKFVLSGDGAAFENLFHRYKKFVASNASRYFCRLRKLTG